MRPVASAGDRFSACSHAPRQKLRAIVWGCGLHSLASTTIPAAPTRACRRACQEQQKRELLNHKPMQSGASMAAPPFELHTLRCRVAGVMGPLSKQAISAAPLEIAMPCLPGT